MQVREGFNKGDYLYLYTKVFLIYNKNFPNCHKEINKTKVESVQLG